VQPQRAFQNLKIALEIENGRREIRRRVETHHVSDRPLALRAARDALIDTPTFTDISTGIRVGVVQGEAIAAVPQIARC
jgi:hypothetical protein